MAAAANLINSAAITTAAREIDFVSQFSRDLSALREAWNLSTPIRKPAGAEIKGKTASVTLQPGAVAEGDTIPYSKATVAPVSLGTINLEKYRTGVTIEAIKDHGYANAVAETEEAFRGELRDKILDKFYNYLETGTLTGTKATFQAAVANAIGKAKAQFQGLKKDANRVVVFVNTVDFYDYLGNQAITVQTQFGMEYVTNFLGAAVMVLSDKVTSGKVIATPVKNVVIYYVDPSDADFADAGLVYTTDDELPLVGFHTEGNYGTAVSDMFAIMGVVMAAEYLNGIAVITVSAS